MAQGLSGARREGAWGKMGIRGSGLTPHVLFPGIRRVRRNQHPGIWCSGEWVWGAFKRLTVRSNPAGHCIGQRAGPRNPPTPASDPHCDRDRSAFTAAHSLSSLGRWLWNLFQSQFWDFHSFIQKDIH